MNRVGEAREYYRVGIDECYRLVGLIRIALAGALGRGGGLGRDRPASSTAASTRSGVRMPDLNFQVEGAEPQRFAAAPLAALQAARLRGRRRRRRADADPLRRPPLPGPDRAGRTVATRPRRRSGSSTSSARRSAGGRRSGRCSGRTSAPSSRRSTGAADVDLPVPCSYDFNLAATKYFAALEGGDIPLCFLFSGTIFYEADDGALQVARSPGRRRPTSACRRRPGAS